MLMFAIVFRHPDTCDSYRHLSKLLEMTLQSACNQSVDDFIIVVVCNTQPEIGVYDKRVVFKIVDFPIPESRHQVLLDKGVKRLVAIKYALEHKRISHFMTLDADDLVSNQLVSKVQAYLKENPNGLTLNRGYLLDFNDHRLQEKFGFNHYCGSSLVLNLDLIMTYLGCEQETLKACTDYNNFLDICDQYVVKELLGDHRQPKHYFKEKGRPLTGVKEPLTTWVINNGENVSRTTVGKGTKGIDQQYLDEFSLNGVITANKASVVDFFIERARFIKSFIGHFYRELLLLIR